MGQSAGAGSPIWFMCPVERRQRHDARYGYWPNGVPRHHVTLTGETKPSQRKRGSTRGTRSSSLSREYDCSCGYHGWSNHKDLERMADHGSQ